VQVDAKNYEFVDQFDTNSVARNRVRTFNSRADIEGFVSKAIDDDANALHRMVDDPTVAPYDTLKLLEVISNQVESGALLVQQGLGGSGAPKAASRPAIPGSDATEGISKRYSPEMKRYIADHQGNYDRFGGIKPEFLDAQAGPGQNNASSVQAEKSVLAQSNGSLVGTLLADMDQDELRFKITVEIAGRNPCPKQHIEINALTDDKSAPAEQQAQKNRGVHHNKDPHRSIIEFKKLPNTPRELVIVISTKGYGSDIRLPLNVSVTPNDSHTEKAEWDNVLVPVKPLAYVTKTKNQQEADVLKPGWIYIFWRGKLWRELHVQKNQAMQDVNVEYYRKNWNGDFGQESEREAEGHWQTAAWVPYKLGGEIQSGNNAPLMMYSETQLDWPYIESLEADNAKLKEVATELDLSAYSSEQHYKNASGSMGSIETALQDQYIDPEQNGYQFISEKGKDLRGYRNSMVPVVYLPAGGDKFILCVQDQKGNKLRNKKVSFDFGGLRVERVTDNNGIIEIALEDNETLEGTFQFFNDEKSVNSTHQGKMKVVEGLMADVSTIEGQQTRFNNLGFDAGVVDGLMGRRTRGAARGFQKSNSLDVDGIIGPKTQAKLKQVYQQ